MVLIEVNSNGEYMDAAWYHRLGIQALAEARWRYDVLLAREAARASLIRSRRNVLDAIAAGRELREIAELYRDAVRCLVEAFLTDRTNYANCFTWAHRAGEELEQRFSCDWSYDETTQDYYLSCPIDALHQMWATSVGWVTSKRCSVCHAPPLSCAHIPGREYGDVTCHLEYEQFESFDHVAMTANPQFSYTWHRRRTESAAALLEEGAIAAAGERRQCDHCSRGCSGGIVGPTTNDLDPVTRYNHWMKEHLATRAIGSGEEATTGIPLLPWHPSGRPG